MNHRNGFNPLSRTTAHRRAMSRNMVTSLFRFERITTTKSKALEVRKAAEKLITGGKTRVGSNTWYPFSDLVSYDLLEDDSLITSGGVGQALIGGALFGGAGSIAGAITGKRVQKKRIDSLYIKVTLNNFDTPCILIPLITKPTKTNSKEYQIAFQEAHKILSVLDVISHNQ